MHHRQNTWGESPDRQPESLVRKGSVLVSVKGHLEKSGLMGKSNDGQRPGSGEKVTKAEPCTVQEDKSQQQEPWPLSVYQEPAKYSRGTALFQPHNNQGEQILLVLLLLLPFYR